MYAYPTGFVCLNFFLYLVYRRVALRFLPFPRLFLFFFLSFILFSLPADTGTHYLSLLNTLESTSAKGQRNVPVKSSPRFPLNIPSSRACSLNKIFINICYVQNHRIIVSLFFTGDDSKLVSRFEWIIDLLQTCCFKKENIRNFLSRFSSWEKGTKKEKYKHTFFKYEASKLIFFLQFSSCRTCFPYTYSHVYFTFTDGGMETVSENLLRTRWWFKVHHHLRPSVFAVPAGWRANPSEHDSSAYAPPSQNTSVRKARARRTHRALRGGPARNHATMNPPKEALVHLQPPRQGASRRWPAVRDSSAHDALRIPSLEAATLFLNPCLKGGS